MRDYVILTDSSCDLPAELAQELGIEVVSLSLLLDGKEYINYLDGREIGFKAFYDAIREGKTATTSAANIATFKEAMKAVPKGFIAMVPAIMILTMATSLKNMTGLLDSDAFVKAALANAGSLQMFLPAIIFLVACGISFATGTSWGTFGILIPIVLAIFPVGSPLGIIGMSACLAGSVCGDHCSPISDTTIMSSAGAQCDHINHVSTQLPYALTVAVVSFVSFIIAGFVQNVIICLPLGIVLTVATLYGIKLYENKKNAA